MLKSVMGLHDFDIQTEPAGVRQRGKGVQRPSLGSIAVELATEMHIGTGRCYDIYSDERPNQMTEKGSKAIGYVRVSTQEQASQGVSLEAQRERIKAYCHLAGLELTRIIADEGISGTVPLTDRESGKSLSATLGRRNKDVTHVVALKLDRLFRDASDALDQTRTWDKQGVTLHLIDMGGQTLSSTGAMGRMMLTMMAAFAELERNLIAERTRAAMQHKRRTRSVYNHTPLGFTRQGEILAENSDEMQIVYLIKSMRARGLSLARIAQKLNQEGVPTKKGRNWFASTVSNVLGNPLYEAVQ